MASIWINDRHMRLKTYSASVVRARSIVKIEIEVDEPGALGLLLEELGQIERDQKKAEADRKAAAKKPARPLALPAPPLGLPYYGKDDQ